jgi:Ice-binding-like
MIQPFRTTSRIRSTFRILAVVSLAAFLGSVSPGGATAAAATSGSSPAFAVLAGTAVTCTDSRITGDVGVWPGNAVARTGCTIAGAVHTSDAAAEAAFLEFATAFADLRDNPPRCRATLTGTLSGEALLPGIYCVDAVAKTGALVLDAQGNANATWLFLVDGALTATNLNVVMINGGTPCNVTWWVRAAATLTDSHFAGTILAGAAITVTRGTGSGDLFATAAVTVTGATITGCPEAAPGGRHGGHMHGRCNQGVGNGEEGCDPGDSDHHHDSNDERGGGPGHPGRKHGGR